MCENKRCDGKTDHCCSSKGCGGKYGGPRKCVIKKEEEKPLTNQEDRKEKNENSLLNYECDENDDGADWET